MKTKTLIQKLAILMIIMALSGVEKVFADGSASMYPAQEKEDLKFRASLLSGTCSESNGYNVAVPFPTYGTLKVYVNAGEHIYVASSALGVGSGKIVWRAPNNTTGEVTTGEITKTTDGGYIANRTQELAGPQYGTVTGGNRYKAYRLTVGSGQSGVWEIDFYGPTSNKNHSFPSSGESDRKVGSWSERNDQPYVSAFDITVTNSADNAKIPGRVYATVLNTMVAKGDNWYTTYYVLTNTGYLYDVSTNGQNGHFNTFFANNKGVQSGGTQIVYKGAMPTSTAKSMYGGVKTQMSQKLAASNNYVSSNVINTYDPRRPDYRKTIKDINGNDVVYYEDMTHKIFFEKPANDLPEMAPAVYGSVIDTTWLLTHLNADDVPDLTDLKMVGRESNKPGVFGPEGVSIYFKSNMQGEYHIEMSFENDKYKSRVFEGICVEGENKVDWDGLDGNGVPFQNNARISLAGKLKTAEIHFPFIDLEANTGGLSLRLYKPDFSGIAKEEIYWNDGTLGGKVGTGESAKDGTAGAKSPSHKWTTGGSNRGDNAVIDTWTYAESENIEANAITFTKKYIDLEILNVTTDKTEARVGDILTYTLVVRNNNKGKVTFEGEQVTVNADADSASVGVWFPNGGFYTTEVVKVESNDPNCKVIQQPSGEEWGLGFITLAAGDTAKVEVKGYAGAKLAHSAIQPLGFIMRPGDVFEIDSKNVVGDGMPLHPNTEYDEDDCNNLMLSDKIIFLLNSAPSLVDDEFTNRTGDVLTDNVLANDIDVDEDEMIVTFFTIGTTNYNAGQTATVSGVGTFTMDASGEFTFTPLSTYSETFRLKYTVSDQYDNSANHDGDLAPGLDTANVSIIISQNRAPKINPITATIKAQRNAVVVPINIYDLDENDALTVTLSGTNSNKFQYKNGQLYYIGGIISDTADYKIAIAVNDGSVTTSRNVTVTVQGNSGPTITPSNVTITLKQGTSSGAFVLVPVVIKDPDGNAINPSSVAISGSTIFKFADGNLYYVVQSGDVSKSGNQHLYKLTINIADDQGINTKCNLNVTINCVGDNLATPEVQLTRKNGVYGCTLAQALEYKLNVTGVNGVWEFKDENLVSYLPTDRLGVGTYKIYVTFVPQGANAYGLKDKVTKASEVTISKRKINLLSGSATRAYNQEPLSAETVTVQSGSDGFFENEGFVYSNFASQTNVGSKSNTFKYQGKQGTDTANYKVTITKGTLTVTQKQGTTDNEILSLASTSFVYDGTAQTPAVTLKIDGKVVPSGEYSVSYSNNKNAGTATVTISDAKVGSGNYELVDKSITFTIAKRTVTLTWSATSLTYNGAEQTVTATTGNVVAGESCNVATYSGNKGTNVNSYTAKALTLSSPTNYQLPSTTTHSWNITAKEIASTDYTITLGATSYTYDKTAKTPTVTVKVGSTVIPSSEYTVSYTNNTNAGTATVSIANATGGNYTVKPKTASFTINKATVTLDWGTASFTYTGSEQTLTPTLGGIKSGDSCTPTLTGNKGTNVGSYTANVTALSNSNYQLPTTTSKAWTITAKTLEVANQTVTLSATEYTYDGSAHTPTVTIVDKTTGKTVASSEYKVEYPTNKTDAGTKTITITDNKADGNYVITQNTTKTYEIKKRAVTIKSGTDSKVYDGTALKKETVSVTSGSFVTGQGLDYSGFASLTNAGSIDNSFSYSAKAGTNLSNYTITKQTGTLTVNKCSTNPDITLGTTTLKYNGQAQEQSVTVKIGETTLVKDVDYTLAYSGNTNASTNAKVTITAKGNYSFAKADRTYTIAKRSVTLTSKTTSKSYDGTALTSSEVTVSGDGFVTGEGVQSYSVTGTQTTVGSSSNTFTYTLKSNTSADNYTITKSEGTLTVSAASGTQTVELSATDFTYNGSEQTPNVVVKINGSVVPSTEYNVSYSKTDKTNVGTITVNIAKATNSNYDIETDAKTYTISAKEVGLSWGNASLTYTGSAQSITATVTGLIGTDACAVTAYENNSKTNAGTYTAKATTLNNSNYKLPATATKQWTIATEGTAPSSSNLSSTSFTYDKTAKTPTATVVVKGRTLVAGTDYTISYQNNTNAGTATATIKAKGNYSFADVTKTFTINPITATLKWGTTSFTYDGTAKVVTASVDNVLSGESCSVTLTGNSATNAGSYTATASSLGNTNYKLPANKTQSWSIAAKSVDAKDYTITVGSEAEGYVYDGNEKEPSVTVKIGAVTIPSSEYSVAYTNNTNAGTATITISDATGGNYSLVSKTTNFTIGKVKITLTSANGSKTYDGTALSAKTVTPTGSFVGTEGLSYSGFTELTNAGTASNDFTYTATGGLDVDNYEFTKVKGTLTVTAKTLTSANISAELSSSSFTYNGSQQRPTVTLYDSSVNPKVAIASSEYTVTYPTNTTDAGTIKLTISDNANGNYSIGSKEVTYTINKVAITLTSGTASKDYDQTPLKKEEVNVTSGSFVGTEGVQSYSNYASITAVGSADNTFEYSLKSNTKAANYNITVVKGKLTVRAKASKPSVTVDGTSFTYNGSAQTPSVVVKVDGKVVPSTEYTVSYSGNTNAGTATVTVTDKSGGNYTLTTATTTFTIDKKAVTLDWGNSTTFTYDGTQKSVTATVGGLIGSETCEVSTYTGNEATNAGNYTATATALSNGNYKLPATATRSWVINKANLSATNYEIVLSDNNPTYTGLEIEPTVTLKVGDVTIPSSEYSVTYSDNTNAGQATVSIANATGGNYTIASGNKSFTIAKAALSVTGTTATTKTYDGTTSVNITVGTVSGQKNGETLTVTATGTTADKNAGDNKAVTVVYTVSGDTKSNYTISGNDVTVNISKRAVTLKSGSSTRTYNGKALKNESVDITSGSMAGTEEFEYSEFASITVAGSTNNTYTVTAKAGTSLDNYNITKQYGTLTVNPASATDQVITLSFEEATYTGKPLTPTVTITTDGNVIPSSEYEVSYEDNTNAGTAKVIITNKSGGSYIVTDTVETFGINPAPLTVTGTTGVSKSYDGTTAVEITVGTVTGQQNGETVTVTATGDAESKDAGTQNVTVTYTVSGATASNYTLSSETKTVKIEKRAIGLTSASNSKQYDGTPLTARTVTVTSGSFVTGESFEYSSFASIDTAGTVQNKFDYDAVSGTNKSNYNVTLTFGTLTVTRKPLAVDGQVIKLSESSVVYNGTQQHPTVTLEDALHNVIPSTEYTVTYSEGCTNAGEYTVTIADNGKGNYEITSNSTTFTIAKKEVSLDWGSSTFTYDGTKKYVSLELEGLVGSDACTFVTENDTAIEAGTYTAEVVSLGNSNYKLPEVTTKSWTINKRSVTASDLTIELSNDNPTYTGEAITPTVVIKDDLGNVIPTDEYTIEYSDNVSAGVATITITNSTEGDDNYQIGDAEKKFTIEKKTVTPSTTSVTATKTYDGTNEATVVASVEGAVESDGEILEATATYSTKNVGDNITITVNYSLNNSNYQLSKTSEVVSTNGKIEALQLTATADVANTKTYDGTDVAEMSNINVTGIVDGDEVIVSGTATYESVAVGNSTINASYSLSGAQSGNYLAPVSFTVDGTISQPTNEIFTTGLTSVGDNNYTYGDAKVGEGALSVKVDETVGANYTEGAYKYYIDGVEIDKSTLVNAGNHTYYVVYTNPDGVEVKSEEYSIVIGQKSITVTGTVVENKDYDGTTNAKVISFGTLEGLVPGGTAVAIDTAIARFHDVTFGEDKDVTVEYTLIGDDAGNYKVENSIVKAVINEVDIAFSWSTTTAEYGDRITGKINATYVGTDVNEGGTYTYYLIDAGGDIIVDTNRIFTPGTYQIYVEYTDGVNTATSLKKSVTFGKATLVPEISLVTTKEYDGTTDAEVTVTNFTGKVVDADIVNVIATAKYEDARVDTAKNIIVTYSLEGDNESYYRIETNEFRKGSITQPEPTWTVDTVENAVYGEAVIGTTITGGAGTLPGGSYTYYIDSVLVEAPCVVPAGKHEITIVYKNEDGVEVSYSFDYEIAKKELTVTGATVNPKTYDGTTEATLATTGTIISGIVGTDIVTIDSIGTTATYEDANAGTDKKVTIVYHIAGADSSNYFIPDEVLTNGVIEKGIPAIEQYSTSTTDSLVYDGKEKNIVVDGPGEYEVYFSNDGGNTWTTDNPINAGEYQVKIVVKESDNMAAASLENPEWSFTIEKSEKSAPKVTGKPVSTEGASDGEIIGLTAEMEVLMPGQTEFTQVSGTTTLQLPVGTYKVRYAESSNYLASPVVEVKIGVGRYYRNADDYDVIIPSADSLVYNGQPKDVEVEGDGDITVMYSGDGGKTWTPTKPVNAGEWIVKIVVAENDKFFAAEFTNPEWVINITKAERTAPQVTTKPASSATAEDGEIIGWTEEMEILMPGQTEFVQVSGTTIKLPAGTYKIRYAESGNYKASAEIEVVIGIEKRERSINDYSVNLPKWDVVYDGTAKPVTANGDGDITIWYSADGGKTWTTEEPVEPGVYLVRLSVAESDEYYAAEFTNPDWKFSIVTGMIDMVDGNSFGVDFNGYCPGSTGTVQFKIIAGNPSEYRAVIESANSQNIANVDYVALNNSDEFEIEIPQFDAGNYVVRVQFRNAQGDISPVYPFDIKLNLTEAYITDIWSDVVSVINKVDLNAPDNLEKRFNEYQWYRDGEMIEGATRAYYCEPGGLNGTYYVAVKTIAGDSLRTCSRTWDNATTTLMVYPNPVIETATVRLSKDDGSEHQLSISNNNGVVIMKSEFIGIQTSINLMQLPQGSYAVTVDGILVKVIKK